MTPRTLETLIDVHTETVTGKPATTIRSAPPLTQDIVDDLAALTG